MKNKTFDELVKEGSYALSEAMQLGGTQEMEKVLRAYMENAILWNALQTNKDSSKVLSKGE